MFGPVNVFKKTKGVHPEAQMMSSDANLLRLGEEKAQSPFDQFPSLLVVIDSSLPTKILFSLPFFNFRCASCRVHTYSDR